MTHLRNLISSLMFKLKTVVLYNQLVSKGVINNKVTLGKLKNIHKGVKKRIAKLTKKMREAERQKRRAISYAERTKKERDEFKTQSISLDKNYATEMEGRIHHLLLQLKLS